MIPVSVDIDTFFYIIFYHRPIPQLGEYKMHLRCCLCWIFQEILLDQYVGGGLVEETAANNTESFYCR